MNELIKYLLFGIDIIFPSELREEVIKVAQKIFIYFGANYICNTINLLLISNNNNGNNNDNNNSNDDNSNDNSNRNNSSNNINILFGHLSSLEAKIRFVKSLHSTSISNDWKKFKSILKNIQKSSIQIL